MRNLAVGIVPLGSLRVSFGSFIVACTLATLFVSLTGCGGRTPTSPTVAPTPSSGPTSPTPTLVSPINGGYVQQNDPATNCRYDPVYGYGFMATFIWTAPAGTGDINSYDIELKHPDASVPVFSQRLQATRYPYIGCNWVAGSTQGWQWKVRANTSDGRQGEWSKPYYLNFTECRLVNGLRCAEQPPQ
jgi:hypothetical protein